MHAAHEALLADLKRYKIEDKRVLKAMAAVRRHIFIPEVYRTLSDPYGDHPCSIGYEQTISQPYIVAYMTQRIALKHDAKVLEIGTGSGYQAAVLAEMGAQVYSIERIQELATHANKSLTSEGYSSVQLKCGDGHIGWPEYAPFDAIIVTCAPSHIPEPLQLQLKDGGRMILPVGVDFQQLIVIEKHGGTFHKLSDLPVRFVPMLEGHN